MIINSPVAADVGDVGDVRVRDVEDVRDVRDVRVRDVENVRDVRDVRARDMEDVRNWGGDVFKRSLWYMVKSRETVHAHNILSQN